jgi:hypothetical protein
MSLSALSPRRRRLLIAALTFVVYGYFVGGYVNNVMNNSIADLAVAIVDDHTLHIDPYAGNSNDIAERENHIYSGFAPGLSLMWVPVYALLRPAIALIPERVLARTDSMLIRSTTEGSPVLKASQSRTAVLLLIVAATLAFAVPLGILSMFRFVDLCERSFRGLSNGDRLALVFLFSFGTLVMAFATNIAHTSVAALLIWLAASSAFLEREDRFVRRVGIGALLGLASIVDYPAALFAAYAGAFVVLRAPSRRRLDAARALVLGGAAPVLVCAWYHFAAFGSAFTNSYRFRVHKVDRSVFNLADPAQSLPSAAKLFVGFLHPYSGILIYHPLMLFGLVASLILAIRERVYETKALWVLACVTIATNLLIYCSYPLSIGPSSGPEFLIRYTVYSAPFAALALAGFLDHTRERHPAIRKMSWAVVIANAVPVWAFAFYGCPVFPTRRYSSLLADIGPANYTLTKLHQAHILSSPMWGWLGFSLIAGVLYCWRNLVAGLVGQGGQPDHGPRMVEAASAIVDHAQEESSG